MIKYIYNYITKRPKKEEFYTFVNNDDSPGGQVSKQSTIGDNVKVESGAYILGRTIIEPNTTITAGTIILNNCVILKT